MCTGVFRSNGITLRQRLLGEIEMGAGTYALLVNRTNNSCRLSSASMRVTHGCIYHIQGLGYVLIVEVHFQYWYLGQEFHYFS